MSLPLKVVSCDPEDALFTEVSSFIYGVNNVVDPRNEVDRDYLIKCLVLVEGEEVLGRMAVYHNDALTHQHKPVVQFGNFECIDDTKAAGVLLGAGLEIAEQYGAGFAIGPMNGSTWNQYRFISSSGSYPQFFTEQSHPAYYPGLWEHSGFVSRHEYVSNISVIPPDASAGATFFAACDMQVRNIDPDRLAEELKGIYPLCTEAFEGNPFYSSISKEKFIAKLIALKPALIGPLTKIVSDRHGIPVAFILCLPDIFDKHKQRLVLKTAAKHPACAIPGVISELYKLVLSEAYSYGFREIIHAFMHTDNKSLIRSMQFDGRTIRNYSLYIRPVNGSGD